MRSDPERRIANWLARNGVAYVYEAEVDGMRPDFVLHGPRVIIEYWGGAGWRDYAGRMAAKTARYEAAGWRVVHLVPANLWELERVLAARLRELDVAQ